MKVNQTLVGDYFLSMSALGSLQCFLRRWTNALFHSWEKKIIVNHPTKISEIFLRYRLWVLLPPLCGGGISEPNLCHLWQSALCDVTTDPLRLVQKHAFDRKAGGLSLWTNMRFGWGQWPQGALKQGSKRPCTLSHAAKLSPQGDKKLNYCVRSQEKHQF